MNPLKNCQKSLRPEAEKWRPRQKLLRPEAEKWRKKIYIKKLKKEAENSEPRKEISRFPPSPVVVDHFSKKRRTLFGEKKKI